MENLPRSCFVSPSEGGNGPFGLGSYKAGYPANMDPRVRIGALGPKIETELPPDRHELFLLQEGEKKITFEPETRTCDRKPPHRAAAPMLTS